MPISPLLDRAVEVAQRENQGLATSSWSPNGKRVAYVWDGSKSEEEVRLVISDADGRREDAGF